MAATGFITVLLLLAVSSAAVAGGSGAAIGLLPVLTLAIATAIAVGGYLTVRGPATVVRHVAAFAGIPRRNLAVAGFMVVSSTVTAVAGGEAGPALCFGHFALFLLGIAMITTGILGAE